VVPSEVGGLRVSEGDMNERSENSARGAKQGVLTFKDLAE